jgi:hypothetical protein
MINNNTKNFTYKMLMLHDEGIWFEEEDPTSEYYRPECCTNVYLDHAVGKFDHLKIVDDDYEDNYDDDYQDAYEEFDDY